MTSLLERLQATPVKKPGEDAAAMPTEVRMVILSAESMLFVRSSEEEAWRLPSGECDSSKLALNACRNALKERIGTTVSVVGSVTHETMGDPGEEPARDVVALAELLHWGSQPKCAEGKGNTLWVSLVEGKDEIARSNLTFEPGTSAWMKALAATVRHKRGFPVQERFENIAAAIKEVEIADSNPAVA